MKNKLSDLNDHLFQQLERLTNAKLAGEELTREVTRAGAIIHVADSIVKNARLQLEAYELTTRFTNGTPKGLPPMLGAGPSASAEVAKS